MAWNALHEGLVKIANPPKNIGNLRVFPNSEALREVISFPNA